jgi:hypothetical protein
MSRLKSYQSIIYSDPKSAHRQRATFLKYVRHAGGEPRVKIITSDGDFRTVPRSQLTELDKVVS